MASSGNIAYLNPNSIAAMIARADAAICDNDRPLAEQMISRIYDRYDQLVAACGRQARARIRQIPAYNRHSRPGSDCKPV